MTLLDELLTALRDGGYRLERVEVATVDDGLRWLQDQVTSETAPVYYEFPSDKTRRDFIRRCLAVRARHHVAWLARGGRADA